MDKLMSVLSARFPKTSVGVARNSKLAKRDDGVWYYGEVGDWAEVGWCGSVVRARYPHSRDCGFNHPTTLKVEG